MNTTENTASNLLTHHLNAFGSNNIKEIISDYDENSVILTISREIQGLTAIEDFFIDLFGLIPKGSPFDMKKSIVKDNITYIVWESKNEARETYFGSDTFVFEDNKIKYHTLIMHKK